MSDKSRDSFFEPILIIPAIKSLSSRPWGGKVTGLQFGSPPFPL